MTITLCPRQVALARPRGPEPEREIGTIAMFDPNAHSDIMFLCSQVGQEAPVDTPY